MHAVERTRTALLESVADLRDDQGAFKPSAHEWSIAEILEHLFLAEFLRFHIERHFEQVRRVRSHPSFPK